MVAGDEPASANFDVGQVAAAHLVVQQVAGQASQAGGFVDGVGQPVGWLWSWLADLQRWQAAGSGRVRVIPIGRIRVHAHARTVCGAATPPSCWTRAGTGVLDDKPEPRRDDGGGLGSALAPSLFRSRT
jgi:hypothetical protein